MPAVWSRSAKVYQTCWKRVAREFCDACGMVIKDDHFYKWSVTYIDGKNAWVDVETASHVNPTCTGLALLEAFKSAMGYTDEG
jgi:hypothetical protein